MRYDFDFYQHSVPDGAAECGVISIFLHPWYCFGY